MKKKELSPEAQKFRGMLKTRRNQANVTQEQLAIMSGVSVDLIRAIEGGRSANPGIFVAFNILSSLGVDMGDLKKWVKNDF